MPDELGQGYAGRVAYLLGYSSINALRQAKIGQVPKESQNKFFIATGVYLSRIAGMDPIEYIASHTLIHYRFLLPKLKNRRDTFIDYTRFLLGEYDGPLDDKVACCPQCISSDMEEFGFSWWRRTHQLPALEVCPIHKTPLYMVSDRNSLARPPLPPQERSEGGSVAAQPTASPIIERFRNFSMWLLNLEAPINPGHLNFAISESMRSYGISKNFKRKPLTCSPSLFVRSQFPKEWLATNYPKLISDDYTGKDLNFDCILSNQGANATILAMLLAALFLDPNELIESMQAHQEEKSSKYDQARAELLPVYIEHMGDIAKISEELNISKRFAYKLCEDAGLPSMSNFLGDARIDFVRRLSSASPEEMASWRQNMQIRPVRRKINRVSGNDKLSYFAELIGIAPVQGELF